MMTLNQEEKEIIKKVIDGMREHDIFCGRFDAKHGNPKIMYGVAFTMSYLIKLVDENYVAEFEAAFFNNMTECVEKIKNKKR